MARHANTQARQLAESLSVFDAVQLVWPVEANQIFIIIPKPLANELRQAGAGFYEWYPQALPKIIKLSKDDAFIRLVTSFLTTTDKQREDFISIIKNYFVSS